MIVDETKVLRSARVLWNYLVSFRHCAFRCDAIVVCCSYDLRVMEYACELLEKGVSDKIIISGGSSRWTEALWTRPESVVFYETYKERLSNYQVLLEDRATNFAENISFSKELLGEVDKIVFMTKPNSLLRVALTAPKHLSGIEFQVASPLYEFPSQVSHVVGLFGLIHEMVGDIDRVMKYPKFGFQVEHKLSFDIYNAWEYLVGQGFDQHLIANSCSS